MDVRLIGRDIGLPGRFVAHVKMKAPGATAQNGRGKKAPGETPTTRGGQKVRENHVKHAEERISGNGKEKEEGTRVHRVHD